MRSILLLFLFFQCGTFLFAQESQHVYNDGYANKIIRTSDGGFIITGAAETNTNERIFLLKTDSAGSAQWLHSFRDLVEFYSYGADVINLSGGGFLCVGMTYNDTSSSEEITLIKTDSAGNKIWAKRMGNSVGNDEPNSLLEKDNDFLIAGFTTDTASEDFYLLKTDSSGNILFSKTYGSSANERGVTLVPYQNGFVFAGSGADSSGDNDICILFLDSLFEIDSSLRISIPGDQQLTAMCIGGDSSIYLASTNQTAVNSPKSLFVKLTSSPAVSWSYELDGNFSTPYSIAESQQGIIVTGSWSRALFRENGFILNIDTVGNLNRTIFFGDSTGCAIRSSFMMNNEVVSAGYITLSSAVQSTLYLNKRSLNDTLTCNSFSENAFLIPVASTLKSLSWQTDTPQTPEINQAMLTSAALLKDSLLCDPTASMEEISSLSNFDFYPNPSDKNFSIVLNGNLLNNEISIYNLLGKIIYKSGSADRVNEIDLGSVPSGIYIIQVKTESITSSRKIIIQH